MRDFAALFERLDQTTSTNAKVAAMADWFGRAAPADAAWAVWFLSGRRLKRLVPAARLRSWLTARTDLADWLVEDAYAQVGDLAETLALLLDAHAEQIVSTTASPTAELPALTTWVEDRIETLRGRDEADQAELVFGWWTDVLNGSCGAARVRELFVLNKLLTGALRVGVSRGLVMRALATVAGVPREVIAHRLMGDWRPTAAWFRTLLVDDTSDADGSRPYPFHLASPLGADGPESLGEPADWLAEWKWDGIRAQLVRRGGETHVWSRGEELVTDRFPEIVELAGELPDGTVLDGELLAWRDGAPLPFATLQQRIGRKTLSRRILAEAPVALLAYDLLEDAGRDVRDRPQQARRARLEAIVAPLRERFGADRIDVSARIAFESWAELGPLRAGARERATEGLMLKHVDAPYHVGRRRGAWWKWKLDPLHVDAVMIYAQAGHGRRSSLHTDYTFAVWDRDELVPIAKAYSGLDDAEIRELDRWIRKHTRERFGPVRSVEPVQVFELAFEGIQRSTRHKAGLALRFPRIARWRHDKPAAEADRLDALQRMLEAHGG